MILTYSQWAAVSAAGFSFCVLVLYVQAREVARLAGQPDFELNERIFLVLMTARLAFIFAGLLPFVALLNYLSGSTLLQVLLLVAYWFGAVCMVRILEPLLLRILVAMTRRRYPHLPYATT